MAQPNLLLSTYGDWERTQLLNNGTEEVNASRLFLQLTIDDRGGVRAGGGLTAYVTPLDGSGAEFGIVPGRFEADIHSPNYGDNNIVVENLHPTADFDSTRVWFNGVEATEQIYDLYVEIDYPQNIATVYLKLLKGSWWRGNVETDITLL